MWAAASGCAIISPYDKTMTFSDFTALVSQNPDGVVLLEGRRTIPEDDAKHAHAIAVSLALKFPQLRFRSGNAEGTDEAFSKGIAEVDSSRLQVVATYASHRKNFRYSNAFYDSPESLSTIEEDEIAFKTAPAVQRTQG